MSSPPEESPRSFAHYRVSGVIGKGGMAVVYAATNERTGADVALKVVHDGAHTEETRARFEHEASIAGKLEHPNIVRVYDFLAEPSGSSVLVMERLRGETLTSLLARRQKLGLVEALAIVLPLLAALDHTHRQGIVHRDVKPSNVFLAKSEGGEVTPKLLDFGIATRPLSSPHLTADDEVLGTPRAMSPEQIRGDAVLDGRSDLFSIASTLVEMMTGEAPFGAKTAAASLVAVLERDVDPPDEIPPRVFVEIDRALRKRAFERHATAAELASALRDAGGSPSPEDLRAALQGLSPVEASLVGTASDTRSDSPVERRKRPRLGRKLVAPAAIAAGLVIGAFVLGSRLGSRGEGASAAAPPASASAPGPTSPSSSAPSASAPAPSASAAATASSSATSTSDTSALPGASAQPKGSAATAPKASAKPRTKPVATRPDF